MQIPRPPHRWSVTPTQAIAIQHRLASQVIQKTPAASFRLIAGVDAAVSRDRSQCIAAVVLWDRSVREAVEQHVAHRALTFPYVPGLLSFREAPAVIAALRKLRQRPDAVICDAHGLAHPRRFGLACHVGVIANLPSVGCAKSRLVGEHRDPPPSRGASTDLIAGGRIVGSVLRTRSGVRPVFVSVGHLIDLASAVRLVLDCSTVFRLPEPTRLADQLVARSKR